MRGAGAARDRVDECSYDADTERQEHRAQAPVEQVGPQRIQKRAHGTALTIAGAVGELPPELDDAALAPAGALAVAPLVRP